MNEPLSTTLVEPADSEAPTIKLWTPRLISIVTLLVGFPSGIILTSINSARTNLRSKALLRLAAAAAGAFAFLIVLVLIPGTVGTIISLAVNFGMIYYLQTRARRDLRQLQATGVIVQKANWFVGLVIGIVVLALWLAAAFGLLLFLELAGVSIPE